MISVVASCHANQAGHLKWNVNGSVYNSNKEHINLELQNVYAGLNYSKNLYVIGFKIDNEGINHPTLVEISSDLNATKYWSFDQPLADIFVYRDKLHTNNMKGDSFSLEDNNWNKKDLSFPPNSTIVYSDKKSHLIVCHPSSLFKEQNVKGGCYSINPDWQISFTWRTIKPKICDKKLHIFEKKGTGGFLKEVSLDDGKILRSQKLDSIPVDLCNVNSQQNFGVRSFNKILGSGLLMPQLPATEKLAHKLGC